MAPKYRECPACGKHALSIATRCPQCGHELLSQPIRSQATRPVTRRAWPLIGTAMALGGIALAIAIARRGTAGVVRALPPASLDTAYPVMVLGTTHAAAALELTDPEEAPAPPDSTPSPDAVPRVARTWTKVHNRRSVHADLVAVLLPGDTVLVDSLRGRWWRVALEGRVVGYVYAGTLIGD